MSSQALHIGIEVQSKPTADYHRQIRYLEDSDFFWSTFTTLRQRPPPLDPVCYHRVSRLQHHIDLLCAAARSSSIHSYYIQTNTHSNSTLAQHLIMPDVDDELLALVGGDESDAEGSEQAMNISGSGDSEPDGEAEAEPSKSRKGGAPKKSRSKKQDDSEEEEGEA
jgi:hypothetical protein